MSIKLPRIPHLVLCWRDDLDTGEVEEMRLLTAAEFNAIPGPESKARFPAWRAYRPADAALSYPADAWGEQVVSHCGIQGLLGSVIVLNRLTIPQKVLDILARDLTRHGIDFDDVFSRTAA